MNLDEDEEEECAHDEVHKITQTSPRNQHVRRREGADTRVIHMVPKPSAKNPQCNESIRGGSAGKRSAFEMLPVKHEV